MDSPSYAIEPGLLYGRPGPIRSPWNLPFLRRSGLGVIVSLVNTVETKEVEAAGLTHYLLPFEEKLSRPYKTSNDHLIPLLQSFDEILNRHLPQGQPILLHCNAGKDRTGFLLGYYLITRKGLSAKKALKLLRKHKADMLTANDFELAFLALEEWMKETYTGMA